LIEIEGDDGCDTIRARVFAICCGYEDADDLDILRCGAVFKLACGRLFMLGGKAVGLSRELLSRRPP
jgi:hypothetical protein